MAGADLRAALVASCFRGAFPPVDLRAVCLVRAILKFEFRKSELIEDRPRDTRISFHVPDVRRNTGLEVFLRSRGTFLRRNIVARLLAPVLGGLDNGFRL